MSICLNDSRPDCTSRSPAGTLIDCRSLALDTFSRLVIALGVTRSPLCNQVSMTLGVAFSRCAISMSLQALGCLASRLATNPSSHSITSLLRNSATFRLGFIGSGKPSFLCLSCRSLRELTILSF